MMARLCGKWRAARSTCSAMFIGPPPRLGCRHRRGAIARVPLRLHSGGLGTEDWQDLLTEERHGAMHGFGLRARFADLQAQVRDQARFAADDFEAVLGDVVDRASDRDGEGSTAVAASFPGGADVGDG